MFLDDGAWAASLIMLFNTLCLTVCLVKARIQWRLVIDESVIIAMGAAIWLAFERLRLITGHYQTHQSIWLIPLFRLHHYCLNWFNRNVFRKLFVTLSHLEFY